MAELAHQTRALEWCATHPKGWLALEQGLGKSYIAIKDAEKHLPALIVCPAFLRLNWVREILKWADTNTSLTKPRQYSTKIVTDVFEPGHGMYICSYEALSKLQVPSGIRTLILDESRYAKSHKAARTKACMKLARSIPRVRLLDGTPMPNRPAELWAMASALGMTRQTWREWGFYYCAGRIGQWGGYDFRGASHTEELRDLWAKWAFRMTKAEALTLPPKMRRLVVLDGPVDKRERDYDVGELRRNPNPVAFVGLAEVLHEHGKRKVAAAVDYILDVIESERSGETLEYLPSMDHYRPTTGRPVLVGARHKAVVREIHEALCKAGVNARFLTGETSMGDRDLIVNEYQRGLIDAIVGSIEAMGAGLTLTRGRYGIVVESLWSGAAMEQFEDRLHRIGQTLPVQWDYLVVDRSIDAAIVSSIVHKRDVADRVMGDSLRDVISEICP